jgi:hypothetical protein
MKETLTRAADKAGLTRKAALEAQARYAAIPEPQMTYREPLTASQHILHLLLTIFTAGLWAPVWIIRALQGNARRGH